MGAISGPTSSVVWHGNRNTEAVPDPPVPPFQVHTTRGFSLLEILVVITLMGLLAALATPSLVGMADVSTTRSVLNRLVADIHHTRMTAVRTGQRHQLRYEHAEIGGRSCIRSYQIRPQSESDAPVRTVIIPEADRGLCLSTSGNQLTFDARGLATMGRTFTATRGRAEKKVIMSRLGRIRWEE